MTPDGVVKLQETLSVEELEKLHDHLRRCDVHDAHVFAKAKSFSSLKDAFANRMWPAFSHHMHDVIRAEIVLRKALKLTPMASEYFGEQALLYSLNAFWTQKSDRGYKFTHRWHRDADDRKQLVLFIYGTDVLKPEDGAHCYVPGSVGKEIPEPKNDSQFVTILGPAGTMFLSDTNGLHMGKRPEKRRLLLWARWGVSDPPEAYKWDNLTPLEASELSFWPEVSPELRKAAHLVVR